MSGGDPRIRGWVETTVSYLEMTVPPNRARTTGRSGVEVRRAARPTLSFFRYLYDTIGEAYGWANCRLMGEAELRAVIHDPGIEVNVLWLDGVPAGLAELDRRSPPDVELLTFGLLPDFVGRGLGRHLLDWTIDRAWDLRPRRFWLHTCDLDHPRALKLYQDAGLGLYDRRDARQVVLCDMPPPRRSGQIAAIEAC